MRPRRASGLACSLWALSLALVIGSLGYRLVSHSGVGLAAGGGSAIFPFVVVLLFVTAFATVGALLSWKRSSNPIGWLLSSTGLAYALAVFAIFLHSFRGAQAWADWLGNWLWGFGIALTGTFVLLLFPTGTLPSRRWRPVAWVAAIGIGAFVLGRLFAPGLISGSRLANPVGIDGPLGQVFKAMQGAFGLVVLAGMASIVSVGVRFRRSRDIERQQIKWLLFAAALILLAILAQAPIARFARSSDVSTNIQNAVATTSFIFVPVAIGIAVLRYRLYDIDIVVNKTVVYGLLAAFITAVYVARRSGADRPDRTSPCRSSPPRWSPWPSSRSANAYRSWRTGWSTVSGRRRTRCWPASCSRSGEPTPPRTSCPGWLADWPKGRQRPRRRFGSSSAPG
jgi:hypothetical protein